MKVNKHWGSVCVVALTVGLLGACSSDDDDGGGGGGGKGGGLERSAAQKCDDLIDVACDRLVDCFKEASGMHAACVQEARTALPCPRATSVATSYGTCMNLLESSSCQTLFPTDSSGSPELVLPTSCVSVVIVGASDARRLTSSVPVTTDWAALASQQP